MSKGYVAFDFVATIDKGKSMAELLIQLIIVATALWGNAISTRLVVAMSCR
jgi:hypothetical protein